MEEDVCEQEVRDASSIWLLMGKGYRISRSIRLQWFFQHLNAIVAPKAPAEIIDSAEELEILTVLEDSDDCSTNGSEEGVVNKREGEAHPKPLRIVPTTRLSFVDRQYRFVYCIDMSPSMATVDSKTGEVLVDDMFNSIKNSLTGLVQPFCIGNSPLELSPRLYITVIAHTYTDDKECQVLMQGVCLNSKNIQDFLCKLRRKLKELCDRLIDGIITMKGKENQDKQPGFRKNQTSLFHMIRDSLLALFLLPDNASAAIVVVTDGVFILENAYVTDALLAQCRNSTAVVSFLQVGTGFQRASVELGYVPHCTLMQFIATATSGAYLLYCPFIKPSENYKQNIYHQALLCWNFQRDVDRDKVMLSPQELPGHLLLSPWADGLSWSSENRGEQQITVPPQPQQTMRYMENDLKTKISSLLSLRAREGYITDGIRFHQKHDSFKIEVKLVWPWKEHVTIEYIAKATWPLDSVSNQTHVVVNVSGPYEFLVDITNQKPKNRKPLRKIVLQRFEHTMKSLENSDNLLVQLQSFSTQPAASKIPETIAKGSSLFCMTANANSPVLALQYGGVKVKKSSKSPEVQFANFWKPIVSMDTKIWSKWFHCHRISILMKHDRPITKELFIPLTSGQYASVQCRTSINAFNKLLKDWSDFTLLENHTYVKFLSRSEKERPYSFCVLRLAPKGLCIIMRLAFLLGTPGIERSKVTEDFRKQLSGLVAMIDRSPIKEEFSPPPHNRKSEQSNRGEEPCIIFLNKQFERILVKYDSISDEIRSSGLIKPNASELIEAENNLRPPPSQDQGSPRAVLGQYLFNQRWVWSMNMTSSTCFDATGISQVLNTIMKQRLHEGFSFCSFGKGIISMTKEVNVTVNSSEENLSNCCIIQYVIFPPHHKMLTKQQEDSAESDGALQENGDLQMVMEVWVEPQMGTIDIPDSPLSYIHGTEYNKIPQKMFAVDAGIVTEICSYLFLHKMCFDAVLKEKRPNRTPPPDIPTDSFNHTSVVQIPLLFELMPLICKSSLIVSLYPMLLCTNKEQNKENGILLDYLFTTLTHMSDVNLNISADESNSILKHILTRCGTDSSLWQSEHSTCNLPRFSVQGDDEVKFQCFLKSFGSSLVILILPASGKDVQNLWGTEQTEDTDDVEKRMILPFFIFECCFSSLQTIQMKMPDFNLDVLQDYTEALNESALIPRHLNQKLPEYISRDINIYCQAIYDHYFWAMVSAVYECLKKHVPLDPEDVEYAIELFCEESTKEIDVTKFLRTLCSHYRCNTLIVDQLSFDDVVFPDYSSNYHPDNKPLSRLQKRSSSGSSSFKSSRTSLRMKNGECENVPLANEIKKLFMDLLGKHFEQVPNNPYYMFFNDGEIDTESRTSETEYETDSQDASSAHSSTTCFSQNPNEYLNISDNNLSSGPESDNVLDDANEMDDSEESVDIKGQERPMFLHLTCSVHYKTSDDNVLRPISVSSLPTCLGDIFNQISDMASSIDPYSESLTITLDLICLTQPTEPIEDEEWKAPKQVLFKRQHSNDSFYSNHSETSSTAMERQRMLSQVSRDDSYIRQASDSIQNLPPKQRLAVEKACTEIEWLLEDEIASALRHQAPISEDNLDRIAKHIQSSSLSKNCTFEKKYFNFVTGLDKPSNHCLPMFIVELESTPLDYRLKRIGKYYCVVGNLVFEEESDLEGASVLDKIKEKAKVTRKGLGHRRSHSDFTSQRHKVIVDKVKLREKKRPRKRASSWPLIFDRVNADTNFIYGIEQQVTRPQHFTTKPYWEIDGYGDSEEVLSSISHSSTSKGNSTASPYPYESRDLLQRSMSYSEYNKCENKMEVRRRRYSLPNIPRSVMIDDTLVPMDDDDYDDDDFNERSVIPTGCDVTAQMKDRGDVESMVYDDDQMLQPHPQFWLFMQITEELVNVYFHHRQTEPSKSVEHHKNAYNRLLEAMDQICKIVNQRTLLDHLFQTFTVHNLLIAEDEDKIWNNTQENNGSASNDVVFVKSRESTTTPFQSVIHGEYKFKPGFFECALVWQQNITIHNRLTEKTMNAGQSIAMNTVRSVLSRFQAHNRQNVFVIKEQDHCNNVVYVRLSQGSNNTGRTSPVLDEDTVFRPVHEERSRASSITSLPINREDGTVDRIELERQDSFNSFSMMNSKYDDKSSISDGLPQQQDYISFSVFGIREPGQEIKKDVMKLITKKLDYNTLDLINQYIARNPKCKLTPKDVEFIQPPGKLPSKKLQLCVTEFGLKYLHATMFYFHQHLLKKYNTPRYAFPDPMYHFKNYTRRSNNSAEPITPNNTYLYNRRDKSEIGIGIVYITLVDQEGRDVIAQPCYPTLIYNHQTFDELEDILENILEVKPFDELEDEDEGYARNFIIEISIWENGDINIDQFENDLMSNLRYAMLDVFLEFHLLNTPICQIPLRLQSSHYSSRRDSVMHRRSSFNQVRSSAQSSASSSATTPKFGKPVVSHTSSAGKKFYSEPGTPVRSDSPAIGATAASTIGKEELKLITEAAGSFPKDYTGSKECSPNESSTMPLMRRTPSSESTKRESPFSSTVTSSNKRESPAMRREGSFTKKDSPVIPRKLSGRENSPLLRKRSASSRSSSVRSESELTTSLDSPLMEDGGNLPQNKVITMRELHQMKMPMAASFVLVTDAEVREAVGNEADKCKKTTWQEVEIKRRLEVDKSKERRNHEHGNKGELHQNYFENTAVLMEDILESGNVCVNKIEGSLHTNYSMESVMNEFSKDIHEKSPDMKPKIFKAVNRMEEGVSVRAYTSYAERTAVKTKEHGETSMDQQQQQGVSLLPGQSTEFIVIGHNAHQWLLSLGVDEDELSDEEEGLSSLEQHGKQRFKPLIYNAGQSAQDRKNLEGEFPSCISMAFVPRQKFFIALFKNKKITLYTYNFTSEVTTALDKQLKRLYAWHNVRTHLNACLFVQKLGLLHHKHFVRDCPDRDDPDVASFASSANRNHLLPLMKEVSPRARERKHVDNYHPPSGVPVPEFDETFRDVIPSKPLHKCDYFKFKDLVKRQAWQFQDVRNIKLHVAYQESRMKEIFDAWKQEGAHVPITEDKLHLLLKRSRFLHYCDAPVLFKDYERKELCGVQNIMKMESVDKVMTDDQDVLEDSTDGGQVEKDDWYQELKWALVQQYIQYLQTLGMCVVQIVPRGGRAVHNRSSSKTFNNRTGEERETTIKRPEKIIFHLQKTTNGGIILMDVFFKRNNLCYKMSAFQVVSLIGISRYVSERDNRQFFEDVNRYKDLTHLRSFTYDFHIREIQNHLSGRHSRFQKTYSVHKLMSLIMKEYPRPPRFCRCILAEGFVSIPCSTDLTPSTVYNYFVLNSNIYDLAKVPVSKATSHLAAGNVLTYSYNSEKEPLQFPESWRTRRDKTEYDGNVAIHFIPTDNVDVINLPFFIALGNKKEFYPRPHMSSNVSSLKRRQRVTSNMDFVQEPEIVKQKARVRFSGPSDSKESVEIHEVHSTGSLRRNPSWNSNLMDANSHSTTSIRSSESDSSLSSSKNIYSPKISPGKTNATSIVFKMSPDQHLSGGSPDSDASNEIFLTRAHNSVITTQENYLQNEIRFVNGEIMRVRDHLNNKVGRCLSNCWRDLLWHNLLIAETYDDDKKNRNKRPPNDTNLSQLSSVITEWEKEHLMEDLKKAIHQTDAHVTYSTMKLLIGLVESFPMEDIENRIAEAFTFVQAGMQQQIIRNLVVKYGNYCRRFVSDDGDNTYLCILNPNDLDMFYLVLAIESQGMMEFSVVYRCKPSATPLECKTDDQLTVNEKNARRHIENVNTCLCYNLWMQLLPN